MTAVLHVAQPVDGGVGRYVAELAAAEHRAGLRVTVATPPGWVADEVRAAGLQWARWDATRSPGASVAHEVRALAKVIAEVAPDVVHLHSSKAGLAGRLLLRGRRPTIFQPHGWAWQAVTGAVAAASTSWERWAARWTTALLCVSAEEQIAGERHGVRADARTHVVPNGVDLDRFRVAGPDERAVLRRELGLPADRPVVVCVGRLNQQKGQDVLLHAWPTVREHCPGAVLALVGDGPGRESLRGLVARQAVDDVVFAGADMQVQRWYAVSDVVAFTSRWGEAMPLTPLEAMASGRPLVASDVAGVRSALGPGCGAVVSPGDPASLAAELVRRLTDPTLRAAEGAAARRWAEQHHDSRATYARVADLTRRVAGGPARSSADGDRQQT